MTRDKQLLTIALDEVIEKRRLDQALNAKEFAVLAGVSYSTAREWFRQPGFPALSGVVFWQDFVQWRRTKSAMTKNSNVPTLIKTNNVPAFTGKAAALLAEAE